MNKELIFVTTGTQFAFDRLISQVNEWAGEKKSIRVIAQTANSEKSFDNIETVDFLTPKEYSSYIEQSKVIVGHAGMGTIITGFEQKKPLILMARKYEFGEHRNNHQQSTVDKFTNTKGIYIANDEKQLLTLLQNYQKLDYARESDTKNKERLIEFLSNEIKRK